MPWRQEPLLVDNVFTNNYNVNDQFLQGILTTDISDHYIIFHVWDKICPSNDQFQLVRLINGKRMETYKRSISDTDWSILDQYENCESYFKHFMDMYNTVYDQSFPVVKVKRKYRNRLPWLTIGLKESIKKKNNLYKISVKHPTAHNITVYKNYRNMLHSLLKLEEKKYYQSMIIANRHNHRKTWMEIKQVINQSKSTKSAGEFIYNDKTTNDRSVIANAFNNFFVNIGPTLASKIPVMGGQFKSYMPATNDIPMFVAPVSEPEMKKLIMQLNDGAPGRDGVTAKSLKCITDHIAMPLTRLANLSFTQGVFPRDLKVAMVSPLYKAKDPMIFSNYRPISLLSSFSKILEKLMPNRLLNFLNKCDILNKYQFGFRNNHSTYMALIILLENFNNALDKGECSIGIFLDFQKAFDTVNHGILLDKLYHYGIRGPA